MRGHDLMADQQAAPSPSPSPAGGGAVFVVPPKLVLNGYGPTGFEVGNALKKVDRASRQTAEQGSLYLCGSVLAFPSACFLWNVEGGGGVTPASLSPVLLHREPSPIEYLFVGCNDEISPRRWDGIQQFFRGHGIVAERMGLLNALGTFNILNAEDRPVAAALVLDPNEEGDDEEEGEDGDNDGDNR
jgi:uncharacterized protein